MNRTFWFFIIISVIVAVVSGCTTFRAISVMNGGRPTADDVPSSEISFKTKGEHIIIVPVRINNSDKQYNFMLDTGAPYIATLPESLVEKTEAHKNNQVVHSKGNIWGAAFKASENNQLLRLKYLQIGTLKLNNIPVISLPSNDMLLGYILQ